MISAMRKAYAALTVAAAIYTCVEIVVGYTSAIAFPISFFEVLGKKAGWFCVVFLTFSIPFFLVSMMLLPLLGFVAESEAFRYSFITLTGFVVMMMWRLAEDLHSVLDAGYSDLVPRLAGVCSILLAGWITGRRYAAT